MPDARPAASTRSGSNRDDLRQGNLATLLRLVYQNRTISRADLTSATGLNRSTISDLISELAALGLVSEIDTKTEGRVGRPSNTVRISDSHFAISVIPRHHSTSVALVGMDGRMVARERVVTPIHPSPEEVCEAIARGIAVVTSSLKKRDRLIGVAVAISGQIDSQNNSVRVCSMLRWVDVPFGAMLEERTGLRVKLDNDGTLACLAESTFGAGKGFDDIVYLFGGAGGIGGGFMIGGQLVRGSRGFAGELGHIRVSDSKRVDSLGLPGTVEALVTRDDLEEVFGLDDPDDEELSASILSTTSPRALRLIDKKVQALALALANLVNIFNPQVIVLSGFLKPLYEVNDYKLLREMRQFSIAGSREHVQIRTADLGSRILEIGGAQLVFGDILNNPTGAK